MPRRSGKTSNAAFDYVRATIPISNIAESVISVVDELDDNLGLKMSRKLDDCLSLHDSKRYFSTPLEDETDYDSFETMLCLK